MNNNFRRKRKELKQNGKRKGGVQVESEAKIDTRKLLMEMVNNKIKVEIYVENKSRKI